jgi:hypothetical protein
LQRLSVSVTPESTNGFFPLELTSARETGVGEFFIFFGRRLHETKRIPLSPSTNFKLGNRSEATMKQTLNAQAFTRNYIY